MPDQVQVRLSVAALVAAVLPLALAGCGGKGAGGPTIGPKACNPLAQTGCATGQKCTWIWTAAGAGALGCVPEGAKTNHQACSYGAEGPTTGFDDCARGLTCLGSPGTPGECRNICDPAATGCPSAETCQLYSGFFAQAQGLCEPTCNPLTQVRLTDSAPACGSPNPAAPTKGCYGLPSQDARASVFTCAPAGPANMTHRTSPGTLMDHIFLNSCAPGYIPFFLDSTGSNVVDCIALCEPAAVWQGNTAGLGGLSPYSCADKGATGAGEECIYWWFYEGATTPVAGFSNVLGVCFDHTRYTYDNDANPVTPDVPYPSCGALAVTDTDMSGKPDYIDFGCGPIVSR